MGDIIEFTRKVVGGVEFTAQECEKCGCQDFVLYSTDSGALSEMCVAACGNCGTVVPDTVFARVSADGIHQPFEEELNGKS